jgi:hypothetical protein
VDGRDDGGSGEQPSFTTPSPTSSEFMWIRKDVVFVIPIYSRAIK